MKRQTETLGVLVVSGSPEAARRLGALLPEARCVPVLYAQDADGALHQSMRDEVELVLLLEPVPGADVDALAETFSAQDRFCVLLLTADDIPRNALEERGVLVLPCSTPDTLIRQAIRLLTAMRFRLRRMEHHTAKLEAKVEDIKIINRAKLLLVQHLKMTETEAHKYIEKQAMDTCMKRRTIAENIIRTYED